MNEEERDRIINQAKIFNVTQIVQSLLHDPRGKKDEGESEQTARPTEYTRQMLMTTEEKMEYILKSSYKRDISGLSESEQLEDCSFEVTPRVVVFQRFTPGDVVNAIVTVRNATQGLQYLKTCYERDPFFSVEHRGSSYSTMLAPGLSHTYIVKFVPEKRKDYDYHLKFATNAGEIVVPVIAIGPRGVLDFPDQIEVPSTAVKIASSKTLFVRNVGDASAVFTLYSDNPQFWIEPFKGRIEEEESLQFTAYFLARESGDFEGKLFLEYETGEKLGIDVRCSAHNCPIRIDRGSIRMEETYLGLSRGKILTIHNRSDYVVKYKWMLFKDEAADEQRKKQYKRLFHLVYESELPRCVDLDHYNVCTPDVHQLVYQRIYADEIESLTKKTFEYSHMCFMLTPQEGEIWPKSSTDVTVFFRAFEVGDVTSTAYLEVTGREDRIPLSLHGTGRGPFFRLNVLTIDLGNLCSTSVHNYEIIAANKGHIPGMLIYKAKPSDFGGRIEVTPSSLILKPNEHKSFNLSFSSNRTGEFVERVDFVVKESLEVLSLHIKLSDISCSKEDCVCLKFYAFRSRRGCIVCPTLHFDKECLNFGTTALGFSSRREAKLHNLSLVPVAFTVSVLDDGDQTALVCEEFAGARTKPSFPTNPREFLVSPEEGVISAQTFIKVQIIYTANIARIGRTVICVKLWDIDSDPITLPIKFCGQVASLSILPPQITHRSCFINYPYSSSFRVENATDLDGYFCLLPQSISEDTPLVYSLSMDQGFIKARRSKTIQLTIIARVVGKHTATLSMLTMGEKSPKECCVITCFCQGPFVYIRPTVLDFGQVQVLEEKPMDLLVINDSPISARFNLISEKIKLPLTISPESGDLEAEKSIKIVVKLYLRDVGKYKGNIVLEVVNGSTISIDLTAVGIGCSVVFEPQIFPVFDLGLLFSHQKITRTIMLKNYGSHRYQIIWSTTPEVEFHRGRVVLPKTLKFQIEPLIVDVPAEGTNVVQCKLLSDEIDKCVEQVWYVFAQIERLGKRQLIGSSTFTVSLTKPQIVFNKKELTFRIDVCPDGDKLQQTDKLSIMNQSKLDLNAQLSVSPPFSLLADTEELVQSMKIVLSDGASTTINVVFYIDNEISHLYSRSYVSELRLVYEQHPNQNKITCRGFVNFPNLLFDTDFTIDCELGSSAEEVLTLINNEPVPVLYKFAWVDDSIEMERDARINHKCKLHLPCGNQDISKTKDTFDGRGDEATRSISLPTNSPASETYTQSRQSEITDTKEASDTTVSSEETREFLNQFVGKYFEKDTESAALEVLSSEPRRNPCVNEVLKIVPNEGTVPAFTAQHVHIGFLGFEQLRVKATAVCQIFRGPFEKINILARADAIRFSVDTDVIDFGEQLFLEPRRKNFILKNLCGIAFQYKVTYSTSTFNQRIDRSHINPLKVEPETDTVDVQSLVTLNVEHQPTTLGPIDRQFNLQIGNSKTVTIMVNAFATFPQVYPCIPRGTAYQQDHSVELEYSAIQSLTTQFIVNKTETVPEACENFLLEKRDLFKDDIEILTAEEWSIVSYDEIFPRNMDIEMAVERHLAKRFVDSNSYIAMQYTTTGQTKPIPRLFSSEYIVDMKYVIIDHASDYSATLINYGPWNVEMRMKMQRKKKLLAKSGILVQLKKQTNLIVGKCAVLRVTWHPTRETFTKRSTAVKHTIYIEVIHGCTIPITIQGTITYPFLTVDPTFVDFQRVVVGECLVLCILIRNEGLVDCDWEAKLSMTGKKRQEECPFYLERNSSRCSPGQAQVVRVSFKPQTTCYVQAKLKILVKMSLETPIISLMAQGIEPKINIIEPTIQFLPVVPFTEIQETTFTIENTSAYPIELFWHHLDDSFQIEDRVVDALLRYYQVKEILLPPRKPGEPLPSSFVEFYNDLINEAAHARSMDSLDEDLLEHRDIRHEIESSYSKKPDNAQDPPQKMKDPVQELFESVERKSTPLENLPDPTTPEKKVCIIFHGAPFTEYQEAACRSGKVLGVPVLSIDKAITEHIALGVSSSSMKLRQIVDDVYHNYMEAYQRHKNREMDEIESQRTKDEFKRARGSSAREKSPMSKGSSRRAKRAEARVASETEESSWDPWTEAILRLVDRSDPLKEFDKLPAVDKLETLDPLSRYEYKLQTILLLEKIFGPYETILSVSQKEKVSAKNVDRSAKRKEALFAGMSSEMLVEALRQRLAANDFKRGFVVQSLESSFLRKSVVEILLHLLHIVGHAEYFLFVTFLNSMADYERKADQLREEYESRSDRSAKIQAIEQMSSSEYDLLDDQDKTMYLERILPGKRERALQRRARFVERTMKHGKRKEIRGRFPSSKSARGRGSVKSSRRERSKKKSTSSRPVSSRRETASKTTRSRDRSKRGRNTSPSSEIKQVVAAMDRYYSDLSAIEIVLRDWDPMKEIIEIPTVARSRVSRSAKSRDIGPPYIAPEVAANKFHVWYVKASDPWQDVMYDTIVTQMSTNHLAKAALLETSPEPDLRPQLYSVLASRNIQKRNRLTPISMLHMRNLQQGGLNIKSERKGLKRAHPIDGCSDVYQLVSLTLASTESVLSITEPPRMDELNAIEKRTEDRRNKKKRGRRSSIRKEEQISTSNAEDRSWIASTSEGKDTQCNVSVLETIQEEPPRPRWILPSNQPQTFKIRFQPEQPGLYEETYALTIVGGNNVTCEVNVSGVADIPTLDTNPSTIFTNISNDQLNDVIVPTYYLNSGIYNFGPILALGNDERPHRREAHLRFCNVSKVDAEVFFSLAENGANSFTIQTEKLLIASGECELLFLSAIAAKLGPISNRLYICIKNNPYVQTIKLQSEGTKLDIQLDRKQLSFGRTLLYRTESQVLTIRSQTAVPIFWRMQVEEPPEPAINFLPVRGTIEPRGQQRIEFQHHGVKVGVIDKKPITFQAFVQEQDEEPIFTNLVFVSGETYDVAVRIDQANPIDLGCIRVNAPTNASFTIRNLGDYEVKYVIALEENRKLAKLKVPANLKQILEIPPTSGSVPSNSNRIVQVTFVPRNELTLKEAAILKCHLVDANKETIIIAEIPLAVSLVAYRTRFNIYPYPVMDFGSLAICTEKTMHLNIENTGKFSFHYSIYVQDGHPSALYMTTDGLEKKRNLKGRSSRSKRSKKPGKSEETDRDRSESRKLTVGPMTVTKTEGDVDVGQTDSIAINCYPEFVGSQQEQITLRVDDSLPERENKKVITLSVNSSVPRLDFQNLDLIFQENWLTDRIQDFDCPKETGPHTVFARQEKCLYFRYVNVSSTHATRFKLYNPDIVPADVEVFLRSESLMPRTAKPDTFRVEPRNECVPSMSYKTFTVSFRPTIIQTFEATLVAVVAMPEHLEDEELSIKLVGESCVPEVAITQPAHGKRETAVLSFRRTLINETSSEQFVLENVGFVKAKIIVEIDEDRNGVFAFSASSDTRRFLQILDTECDDDGSSNQCTMVALMPADVARFNVTFSPTKVNNCTAKIRLFVVNNPYENLMINLEAESYAETIVLDGLELEDGKRKVMVESKDSIHKGRRLSSKQNSLASISTRSAYATSLTYNLDYGLCFVSKMYKKTFKIANKSTDRWYRFQWSAHPSVVFTPSIGHVKYLGCKEIVATFLASNPVNHVNTRLECIVHEIEMSDLTMDRVAWDDRQTEVRWERLTLAYIVEQSEAAELLSRKMVGPSMEPKYQTVPGTAKSIQVLLNATVAFSVYSCPVQEIYFKDTLMFQTREYKFILSNPGAVNTVYAWKITMDEQYPKRQMENASSKPRSPDDVPCSRPNSRSFKGIRSLDKFEKGEPDSANLLPRRCGSSLSETDTFEVRAASNAKASDLFSSTAGLSQRTTDSWLEGDDLPFTIYPETGTILPGQSIESTLKFSPTDVFYYKAYLSCRIENLNPKLPDLTISVAARSLLPYCHFDVQNSDYVSSGRRDPKRPGPVGHEASDDPALWENIRVIEFKVIGIGETHVKKFHLINPTMEDYRFSWKDRTARLPDDIPNFHCTVPEGIAESGKRIELAFTFLAEDVGIFESFWLFSIERYNLKNLFLVVGIVTEPVVRCLTIHAKLKPTTLGLNVRDSISLSNDEDFPIPFKILEESLYSEGKFQKLAVNPITGILPPKYQQLLRVEYHPTRVGEFHFSIQCAVKLMKSPLTIFATATVYEVASSVSYCNAMGEIVEANSDKENVIDLGKVMIHVPIAVKFDLKNTGKITVYYTWDLGITPEIACRNAYKIATSPKQGHVITESQSTCCLTLTAFRKTVVKDHRFVLKISNGPTYRFSLKASSSKPVVEFSFNRYDFGPCYIQEDSAVSYYAELYLTNKDAVPFVMECKFEEQPHLSVDLNSISTALAAGSTIAVPIIFRPLKEIRYREHLTFTINSTNKKKITITGEGIVYKIRLVNVRDKSIDLGSVSAFNTVSRKVPVVNEGLAPVELEFDLLRNLNGDKNHREGLRLCTNQEIEQQENYKQLARTSVLETKRSWTQDTTLATAEPSLSEVLQIEPSNKVVLRTGKTINVLVKFKPTARMSYFTSKVALRTSSTILPLFVVSGRCVGPEFRLNRSHLSFGTLVQGCTDETRLLLINTGDVGARFKWNSSKLPADFKVDPASGYCSSGMDISFVVKFQPSQQRGSVEGELEIEIENYGSLMVKVSGGCTKLAEPTETILFMSPVRQKQIQSVLVTNDTNLPWKLKPQIIGDYFFVEEVLHVPAKSSASCVVTYAPVVTNTEDTMHTGTLLLKTPGIGSSTSYALRGRSLPPKVAEKIQRQFPAKTKYTELLPVHNWLDRQQRFVCEIEHITNDKAQSKTPLFDFVCNNKIDVPANSQRDYRAVFYSYEESRFHFKITFTSEDNHHQFYEIEYNVTEPEVIESIKLTTSVRSQVCHTLKLGNPLDHDSITYTAECNHPFVTVHQLPKVVPPLSHEYIHIRYHPILPSEESVVGLDITCQELGRFPYELRLKATPAAPEKVTRVSATLGASCTFLLPLKNYTNEVAQFTIKVDNDSFMTSKSIQVSKLSDGVINVVYEPHDFENVAATLTASSTVAGDFEFPLIGTCTLPKSMGPYIIRRKSSTSIPFRNVFKETKTFNFLVDVPETFATETPSVTLSPKQAVDIKVRLLEDNQGEGDFIKEKYPDTGKLLVYCADPSLSHINWVYYLSGIFD